jgi:Predicted methyltransferases
MQPSVFLIPVPLGETEISKVIPPYNIEVIRRIDYFVVENIRTARRFLKKVDPGFDIDKLTFYVLNKHTSPMDISTFLTPLHTGHSIGVISEAGCPGVADPGADVVAAAHRLGFPVVPLIGPSSILLALMASGFNGQHFAFHGYLPVEKEKRTEAIMRLEHRIYTEDQTQLFIETPYRNGKLVEDLLKICKPGTKLCIAADITCATEFIQTKPIKNWKGNIPDLSKRPCIFLLYK